MKKFSAAFLLATIVGTVSVMWVSQKWATSVPETGTFLLAAIWALAFLFGRAAPRFSIISIAFLGIIAWASIQIALGSTVYQWPTRLAILYWCGNLAAFFCGLQTFSDRKIRGSFLRWLVILGFVVAVFSTVQALTSQDKVYWHFPTSFPLGPVFGPFLYRNQFAAFVELILPLTVFFAINDRKRRIFYLAAAAALYASVIACASRAGFVLSTLELAIVPALAFRRQAFSRAQLLNGALILAGMLLWLSIPAGPDTLIQKFGQSEAFSARREFNQSSLQMIKARPLLGFGLGNWPTAYPGYALFDDGNFANQAHNDWAQWTVEGGIPLLILMLAIAVWSAVRGIRTGWGLGVPIVFVHCFVDYPIQRPGVAIVFFLLMAAMADGGRGKAEELAS